MSAPERGGPPPDRPHASGPGLPPAPPCPFCEERETELMNPFGSHASVSTYWCRRCRSPFEMLKWRSGADPATSRDEGGRP